MTMTTTTETSAPTTAAPAPEVAPATLAAPAATATPAAPGPAQAVGRRKKSSANCRITPGEGKFTVNGRTLENYFLDPKDRQLAASPLEIVGARSKWSVVVTVGGGGSTGQSGAVALSLARALIKGDSSLEQAIRAAGLVTRDARVKERKKYGRRGARRGFQFSKR
jgi:small subunit ribosomal protein S9